MFQLIIEKFRVVISYIYHAFTDEPENTDGSTGEEEE